MNLHVVEAKGDLWFSQKTLAALFGVTKQNVQIHIRDLQEAGQPASGAAYAIDQAEGARTVKRLIRHYPFEVAHAIAVRSQRFDQLGWLLDLVKEREIETSTYRIAPSRSELSASFCSVPWMESSLSCPNIICRRTSSTSSFQSGGWRSSTTSAITVRLGGCGLTRSGRLHLSGPLGPDSFGSL